MGSRVTKTAGTSGEPEKQDTNFYFTDITPEKVWEEVSEQSNKSSKAKKVDQRRGSGWKIVRIFVSSTFKDFFYEREILVKKVFPALRVFCQTRRLHLIDCDLRWGIPEGTNDEVIIKSCMEEIQRCKDENENPFFINMVSQRCGWVPNGEAVTKDIIDDYNWILGLSVTEMEIMFGAYHMDNPNAIFMIRDQKSVDKLHNSRQIFYEPEKPAKQHEETYKKKLKLLKDNIMAKFPSQQVVTYSVNANNVKKPRSGDYELEIDDIFEKTVLNFFLEAIAVQYPEPEDCVNNYLKSTEDHKAFMLSKARRSGRQEMLTGREELLTEVKAALTTSGASSTVLLVGEAGIGKSSVMAKIANDACEKQIDGFEDYKVFYHFVGAVPRSTELLFLLQRLLYEQGMQERDIPTTLEEAVHTCCSKLSSTSEPLIVVVDALNQFDESADTLNLLVNWIPKEPQPNVRIICSVIEHSTHEHQAHIKLKQRLPKTLKEIKVGPLTQDEKKSLVESFLAQYNKKFNDKERDSLLNITESNTKSPDPSANPLWLMIALEELRIFGKFRDLRKKITEITKKRDLTSLLEYVLERFENEMESTGYPITATLCLLEVSKFGLYETELLELYSKLGITVEDISRKWSVVYSQLKPFLLPYGNRSSGRLDFYHRSLSKAVRHRYLKKQSARKNWHKWLADFFEVYQDIERKFEEYPYHIMELNDKKRMTAFLANWETVDQLLQKDYSATFFQYWNFCGGMTPMVSTYENELQALQPKSTPDLLLAKRYLHVANIFIQEGHPDLVTKALKFAREVDQLLKRVAFDEKQEELEADLWILRTKAYHMKLRLHYKTTEKQQTEQREDVHAALDSAERGLQIVDRIIARNADTDRKQDKGILLIKRAEILCTLKIFRIYAEDPVKDIIETATSAADEARVIFNEIKDHVHEAEAQMTKGLIIRKTENCLYDQIKIYDAALHICKEIFGEFNDMVSRIKSNKAIAYEDAGKDNRLESIEAMKKGNKEMAKEKLELSKKYYRLAYAEFKHNHELAIQLFGKKHSRSKKCGSLYDNSVYWFKSWEIWTI